MPFLPIPPFAAELAGALRSKISRSAARSLISILLVLPLSGCATAFGHSKSTVVIAGQKCCVKHRTPLISIWGFEASSDPLVLVHSADPRSVICDERAPNRIADYQLLGRSKLHPVRGIISYCPQCAAKHWQCMGGDHELTQTDIQQITALVLSRSDFRKPIIRIFPVYDNHAVAIGGNEQQVGDVFSDIGIAKRKGRWRFSEFQIGEYRIIAMGYGPFDLKVRRKKRATSRPH